jgi:type I restriction enzyme, R subunit
VNAALEKRMAARKMLTNASYFAFTATPKNKTLEMFGEPLPPDAEGKVKHRPFHSYTMKQAVEEGFILDVLKAYTPVDSYYKLVKKTEDDPEFDTKKARKKLRRYVESHDHAIRLKAEIMVDHFHEQVLAAGKIGGQARAMVVTSGIERAIQYFHAFKAYLVERKSPYQAIVAFSGEHEYGGAKVSEASLNGFPSNDIAGKIQTDPYRFLICADKFQTGYDEPLLHTMYVDKPLSGIKAVQTLSRLNRAHPQKHDCFVLDFQNNSEAITFAFQDYYRTTLLAEETDPNKLHDLKAALDAAQVYSPEQVQQVVELFLGGADRDQLDPILDACVAVYVDRLDEDGQVDFKGKAKVFCRTYAFLSSVIPYSNAEWEKLSIFLDLLTPKLPAPKEEDLAKGILEAIDMDSYRVEKKAAMKIALADDGCGDRAVPTDAHGARARARAGSAEQHPQVVQRAVRHAVHRHRPGREAHPRRHRAEGRRRRRLPERQGEHPAHRAHGARPGAGQGDAAPAEGRHAGLQAVRRERVVQALRRRHGVCDHDDGGNTMPVRLRPSVPIKDKGLGQMPNPFFFACRAPWRTHGALARNRPPQITRGPTRAP